jgi:hypothetical protein
MEVAGTQTSDFQNASTSMVRDIFCCGITRDTEIYTVPIPPPCLLTAGGQEWVPRSKEASCDHTYVWSLARDMLNSGFAAWQGGELMSCRLIWRHKDISYLGTF